MAEVREIRPGGEGGGGGVRGRGCCPDPGVGVGQCRHFTGVNLDNDNR